MPLDAIKTLPIASLAADDCALFLWCTWPNMPMWRQVIEAWGVSIHEPRLRLDQAESERQKPPLGQWLHHPAESRTVHHREDRQPTAARRWHPQRDHGAGRRAQREARRSLRAHAAALRRPVPRIVRAQAARGLAYVGR